MQTFNLDISVKEIIPLLQVKQKDIGTKIAVTITDNGRAYSIPSGASFSVWFSGKSGNGNYSKIGNRSAFSVQGSTVTVELMLQMLNNPGEHLMCLVMNDANGNQIGLWNIPYYVEELPGANSEPATKYFENLEAAQEAANRAEAAAQSVEGLKPLLVSLKNGGTTSSHTSEQISSHAYSGGDVYLRVADIEQYLSLSYHMQGEATFVHIGENGIVTSYVIDRDGGVRTWSFDLNNSGGGSVAPLIVTLSEDGATASHTSMDIEQHTLHGGLVFLNSGGHNLISLSSTDGSYASFRFATDEDQSSVEYIIDSEGDVERYAAQYMRAWTEADKKQFINEVIAALPVYNGEVQ